ncbi:hypothetical protein ACWOAH_05605 [Vagococcus vulneris]|uniref:Uncharacterized protein n=1 Tax=Vagococcus vulneris TaxID=1977869 RepID=A0A429ZZB6_9ENTE|nr:hypothetical protein [Vagococcus vulneris]RST99359.1 hypothetical protein CBF37_05150 [Vagococcus vulneris]
MDLNGNVVGEYNFLEEKKIPGGKEYLVSVKLRVKKFIPTEAQVVFKVSIQTKDGKLIGQVPLSLLDGNVPTKIIAPGTFNGTGKIIIRNSDLLKGYHLSDIFVIHIFP